MKKLSASVIFMTLFLCSVNSNAQEGFAKRINCGGSEETYNGITFDADASTSSPYSDGELKNTFNAIADPTKPYIKSIRYSKTPTVGNHTMNYTVEVPQLDEYDVLLHFREVYWGVSGGGNGHGARVFDVWIQGQQVENDLDLALQYPGAVHTNTTRVTSTLDPNDNKYKISIDFEASANDPIINGIEILGTPDDPTPPTGGGGHWTKPEGSQNIYYSSGNVGIGTDNPGIWKLAVDGNIRAKGVKVQATWADYVFYDDYSLPTLKQVEKHIKDKGHLINIPSAAEVEANGIELGEMNKLLLEKIEELTLYIIDQNKEQELLKKQVRKLSKKINTISKQ